MEPNLKNRKKVPPIKELREICMPPEKKLMDKEHWWAHFVLRKVSIYITKLSLHLGVPADLMSVWAIIVGVSGCILLSIGEFWYFTIGAVLINLWLFFDCVDGEIARYNGPSKRGWFLDTLGADLMYAGLLLSIGIGVFRSEPTSTIIAFSINPLLYVACGALGSIAILLYRMGGGKLSLIRQNEQKSDSDNAQQENDVQSFSPLRQTIHLIRENFFNQGGFLHPFALIAAMFNLLHIYVIFYGITFSIMYIISIIMYIRILSRNLKM